LVNFSAVIAGKARDPWSHEHTAIYHTNK